MKMVYLESISFTANNFQWTNS